jgi:protocatechuate 3,4-dioxygenase beta subunit
MKRSLQLGVALAVGLGAAVVALSGGALQATAADTCPTYNAPNTLLLSGGTPQSTKLGAMFGDNLQVTLANTNGCPLTTPVAGLAITFVAPSTGPSGTFSSSGSNAVLVGTDAAGSASAPQFTANTLPGGYSVVASSDYGSITFSLVNTASGVPATVARLSPARQSATVGARYGQPLKVQVLDATGNPVPGAAVTFAFGSGASGASGAGGSGASAGASFVGGSAQATATTDAAGLATSPPLEANSTAGKFGAAATVAGVSTRVGFSFDNLAGKTPTVRAVETTAGSATVGARYRSPLQVKVLGSNGEPLLAATVTFTLGSSGGGSGASGGATGAGASFVGGSAQATATTNAAGLATSPRFAANTTAGTFTATASMTGSTGVASFTLHNTAGQPATIAAGVASTESTVVRARFPIRLAVTVTDTHANPVAGALVRFSAPMHGPSGTFAGSRTASVRTNASGIAVAPVFSANSKQGGYIVKATVDHARPAAFALVNEPPGS